MSGIIRTKVPDQAGYRRCRYSGSMSVLGIGTQCSVSNKIHSFQILYKYINGTCRYSQVDKKMGHFPVLVGTGTFNFNIVKIKILQLTFMLVRNNSKFCISTKVQDVLQEHNL